MAKARVAPIEVVSIPRLELLGTVLAIDLVTCLNSNLDQPFKEENTVYWTDSMNILCWLCNQSRDLNTFTANQVAHIQCHSEVYQWRYVHTSQNPADLATRGLSVNQLQNSDLWWKGPDLLLSPNVPDQNEPNIPLVEAAREFKPSKAPFAQSVSWSAKFLATSGTFSTPKGVRGLSILTPKIISSCSKEYVQLPMYSVSFSAHPKEEHNTRAQRNS